ncbi:MAG: cytochrome c oxidase subunit I [Gaiellaceae bacterium]
MSSVTSHHDSAAVHHGPPRPPGGLRRLLYPGLVRAAWMTPLFFGIGCGIVVLCRWWGGWHPIWFGEIIVLVGALTAAPVGFLAGIGAFDYWVRYAIGSPTEPEDHSGHGAYSWKDYFRVNTDHKVIGMQYLATTIFFFLAGGLLAMLVRAELAKPGMQFFDNQTYNGLFSVHASLMIFLFVIPAFAGLANFVVPLMLGAPDMAFPRLNALSYWLLPIAGIMMLSSFAAPGGAFAAGWTGYAPLSIHQPMGTIFFNMGVQWAGASSIMTALNFLVTIITMRAPGMTFWRMPLLVWANFTTSLLVVIATPFIAGSQFFVMFDKVMHTHFFDVAGGGYPLGYQHIFWFYSHPAVYIMMLPGFGIASEVISVFSRKPIFGYRLMALSLMAILVLGFSVWAHHMFVSGMAPWLRVPMMITTLMIAVPTGIKVFSWLATIWEGKITFATPMLWAVGFVSMFVIGGLSGIYLGAVPIDIHTSDTYFVVAHIHYVLFGGSLFTIFAGIYYWFPKMTGRQYNEKLGKLHFWLTFVGFNLTFFPMHLIGTQGMPRRVSDYAPQFGSWNLFISIASFALGASTIVFLYNMVTSMRRGAPAESNPWRALTLEWQVSSPPPIFNFDEIPQVVGNPYEYGVPGARHAVLNGDRAATETEVRSH